jgi:biopolymer transport protein ExbD
MVLMVRAEVMPIKLQAYASADPARTAPAATISILLDGSLHLNRSPVSLEELPARLREARTADPATVIYLALEDGEGAVDRAPILTRLWDSLRTEGLEIHFVGRP